MTPAMTSTTAMKCCACGEPAGEFPWYVLQLTDVEQAAGVIGPLCDICAAIYYPGPRDGREQ